MGTMNTAESFARAAKAFTYPDVKFEVVTPGRLTLYDDNGRGLMLPEGAHLYRSCEGVNSVACGGVAVQVPDSISCYPTRINPETLDQVHAELPGCEWVTP